jgi:hypothetical protein
VSEVDARPATRGVRRLTDARTRCPRCVAASTRQRILDVVGLCLAATHAADLTGDRRVRDRAGRGAGCLGHRRQAEVARRIRRPSSTASWRTRWTTTTRTCRRSCTRRRRSSPRHSPPARPLARRVPTSSSRPRSGIEVCVRLGMAGYDREAANSTFFERGQHATSICGGLGSAAAAALVSGSAPTACANAIGLAASMSSGSSRPTAPAAPSSACTAAGPPTPGSPPPNWFAVDSPGHRRRSRAGSASTRRGCRVSSTRTRSPWARGAVVGPGHLLQALSGEPLHPRRHRRGATPARRGPARRTMSSTRCSRWPPDRAHDRRADRCQATPESGYHAQFSGPYTVAAALSGGGGLGLASRTSPTRLRPAPTSSI